MPSSSRLRTRPVAVAAFFIAAVVAHSPRVRAQQAQQARGFAVERLYLSAPGAGWFVMDDLDMRGRLGGAVSLTSGYSRSALRVTDGEKHLSVVSDEAFTNFGFAITHERLRLTLDLSLPMVITGDSGIVAAYQFAAPYHQDPGSTSTVPVNLSATPDRLSDPRLGFDARLLGDASSPFRLGASAQLFVPSGQRSEYDTDGTYRTMVRVLFAGDIGVLTWAGHVGVHIRPLDDSQTPGSPRGTELLFGIAAGPKVQVGSSGTTVLVLGPELFGETACRSLFQSTTTGFEAMLTGRVEQTGDEQPHVRVKLGAGAGVAQHFGAPEWRIALGVELFDQGHRGPGASREPLR